VILVFDLDDTLYDEASYVHSGFRAVANHIARTYHKDSGKIFRRLCVVETQMGRGNVFDVVLGEIGIRSRASVNKCLSIYRAHKPAIRLRPDAVACLRKFRHLPVYIVTDGNKIVQKKKIRALKLEKHVVRAYLTHHYGMKHAKPSPFCFLKICERERVRPSEVIYVADNPFKDFLGLKPLGFKTIRLIRGPYRTARVKSSHDAHVSIRSLNQITERFLNRLAHV
jgi:putative hydrolase of the HAD superfamily